MPCKHKNHKWKRIPGFENKYSVSCRGKVRQEFNSKYRSVGYIIKIGDDSKGYYRCALHNGYKNGKLVQKHYKVHQLVMLAFVGFPPNGYEINHKDGNKKHNCLDNLEYVTHLENMRHANYHGLVNDKEHRSRTSITHKGVSYNLGRKQNLETKRKISERSKNRLRDKRGRFVHASR